ncbi:alpha-mannosidase 2 isoform X3 [Pitangus sulphuratus]|nr:alpha-mannosidase 2 isoform X3 [Pitangus sulphuratus]
MKVATNVFSTMYDVYVGETVHFPIIKHRGLSLCYWASLLMLHGSMLLSGESLLQGQLSILQEKIDHLERLLAENNEIISNIRDSVINLSESVKDGQKNPEAINFSQGSVSELFPSASVLFAIDSEDCLFASKSGSHGSGVQMVVFGNKDLISHTMKMNGTMNRFKFLLCLTPIMTQYLVHPVAPLLFPKSDSLNIHSEESEKFELTEHLVNQDYCSAERIGQAGLIDQGWLKTFDDYFRDQTQHILNNMVIKLQEDNQRKFIWSEISYFSKWWDGIDSQKKDAVKRLIKDGQFEIVTGGWVMADEASSHYFSLIDQLIEGHQWLEKNLDLGSSTDILCHMMPFYSYDIPHTCGPDPKICCQFDFKRLPGGRVSCPWRVPPEAIHAGNVQHRAWIILDQYRKKSKLFRTKVVLAPLGDDFRYTESSEWDQQYQNYQKLFDYMNSRPEWHVKAQFGTLSDYFEALRKESNLGEKSSNSFFPVLSGDFFTYADRDHHYWSGYFTSRPFYKRLDRVLESYIRAAEILYSLALVQSSKSEKMSVFPSANNYKLLAEARRNLGLFQHHDAITGTAKDWVVVDYGTRLFHSIMNLKKVIIDSAHILILKDKSAYSYDASTPFLKMISFVAHLPPLGIGVYQLLADESSEGVLADYNIYIRNSRQEKADRIFKIKEMENSADNIILENAYLKLWFSGMSGLLEKINTKEDGKNHQMKVEFAWYGTTSNRDKSGAYLFLPDGDAKVQISKNILGLEGQSLEVSNIVDIRGEYNRELAMRISSDINSRNRFYTDLNGYQIQPRLTMSKLPLQANIYPMTTMAYIQDVGVRLTLHSAQSLGVASLKNGQLEVIMDRRLMQDDNRGLGQGVQDNKITANIFRLLLERRHGTDVNEEKAPVSFPSLLSHLTSLFLNHPVIPMTTNAESGVPEVMNIFSPLMLSMPCDMHIVNLRTIQSKVDTEPSDEAALILHRKGFDCRFSNRDMGLLCSTTQGKIKVHKLFNEFRVESLTPTSLSLMHSPPDARNISEINMSSMEINTFRIRLK